MYDIAIVGAGVAGLTAAIYARRANKKVLVLEGKAYGGQILTTMKINNYPGLMGISGPELAKKLHAQADTLGAEFKFEEVQKIEGKAKNFKITTDDGTHEAKTIILAVGATDKKLDLPREDELVGHGISYCATCDGAFYKGKPVAVIGGGNSALYEALYLSDLAEKVYLIHRRSEFRGDDFLVEKLREKSNVEFVLGHVPSGLIGENKIEAIIVKNPETEDEQTIEISGVFVSIGKAPATENYSKLVDLDDKGYIKAHEDCKTSHEGIFAAGDCRTKTLRQLITAAADGANAANSAVDYLG